ncbi:hypothetical protein GCM10028821_42450 [Hymenobacter jeollabukensis]
MQHIAHAAQQLGQGHGGQREQRGGGTAGTTGRHATGKVRNPGGKTQRRAPNAGNNPTGPAPAISVGTDCRRRPASLPGPRLCPNPLTASRLIFVRLISAGAAGNAVYSRRPAGRPASSGQPATRRLFRGLVDLSVNWPEVCAPPGKLSEAAPLL